MSQNKKALSGKRATNRKNPKKNSKRNKIIAISVLSAATVAFIVFIVLVLVHQLGGVRPIKSTEEELKVVGTVDGEEVCYDELRYIAKLYQMSYEIRYGENIWSNGELTTQYRAQLDEDVLSDIRDLHATVSACKSLGIDTDSEEAEDYAQDSVDDIVKEDFDGDVDAYKSFLSANHLTDRFFRYLCEIEYLEARATEAIAGNGEYVKFGDENYTDFLSYVGVSDDYVRTVHVYLGRVSGDLEATEKKLNKAKDIAAELSAIENDEERYDRMCYYIGRTDFVQGVSIGTFDGIYFTKGQMGEDYESAAFALEEYGVSDVVETDEGYFVIMRMPKEEDYIKDNGISLLSEYKAAAWVRYKREFQKNVEFVPNELFESLDLTQIK